MPWKRSLATETPCTCSGVVQIWSGLRFDSVLLSVWRYRQSPVFHVQCQLSVVCWLLSTVSLTDLVFFCLGPVCLTFTSARVLVRALVDGPGLQPTDIGNHTQCAARALTPTLSLRPPHVCHRQKDWAVSISWAPPHLGAPIPLLEYRSRLKTTIQKIGDKLTPRHSCLLQVSQRVFSATPDATCTELLRAISWTLPKLRTCQGLSK